MMHLHRRALPILLALILGGCSWFGWNKPDPYKGAAGRLSQPLEVPPDLTPPTAEDRFSVPDPRAATSYSDYAKQGGPGAAPAAAPAGQSGVLPEVKGVRIEREGNSRWLVVQGSPDRVWAAVRDFWIAAGYPLAVEKPELGIMDTEWRDDETKIPQDFIRRTIGRFVNGLYQSPRRNRFHTRLDWGTEPGTTEVYVTSRSVEEIYTRTDQDMTVWQPLPADREGDLEMLRRMLLKLGGEESRIAGQGPAEVPRGASASAVPVVQSQPNAFIDNGGAGPLLINDGFDRGWRRVGLALDRGGFTVEDRDRSKGIFFVRYNDPDVDVNAQQKKGILDSVAFWRSASKGATPQLRVQVTDNGHDTSRIVVLDAQGEPTNTATGQKILALLYDQLK